MRPVDVGGGDLYVDKSLGSGGTGGTTVSSGASPLVARDATRSLSDVASLEWTLEASLPALFRRALPREWRLDAAEIDVAVVVTDIEAESRELVVGVLAYVVEEVEPRFGVKLDLALAVPFFGVFSEAVEGLKGCSSLLMTLPMGSPLSSAPSVATPNPMSARSFGILLSLEVPLALRARSMAPMPSHCEPLLAGVPGRLPVERVKLATLALALALLPLKPSNLRNASAVASSSIPDQPSCVPRSNECATLGDGCDCGRSLEETSGGVWEAPVPGLRKVKIEDEDGEGGRCEKSVVWTRRALSACVDEEELVDACRLCLSGGLAGLATILRLLLCARPELSRRRSFALLGLPTLRLLCLRTGVLSSFGAFSRSLEEPRRLDTRVPD